MHKKKLIIVSLFALGLFLGGSIVVFAAFDDFQTDSNVILDIGGLSMSLRILSTAKVASTTVDSASVSVTVDSGSTMVIESADRWILTPSGFSSATFHCPAQGASYISIDGSSTETGIITPTASLCSSGGNNNGGGGGGGGGGVVTPVVSVITPSNTSVSIDAGGVETKNSTVTLTLAATNASQMMISNLSSFSGASWETYATSKTWTLASGLGKKTVYAKFKSSSGGESSAVNDDIMLLPAQAVKAITASAGGKVGLSDDLVAVNVPAGAVLKNTSFTISPTSVYTAPKKEKLAGSQVYDLKADADGTSVKNFSKDLTLSFKYTADDIKGLRESSLAVYYWDTTFSKWIKLDSTVDTAKLIVSAKTNHFTMYAVLGEELAASGSLIKIKCDGKNKDVCSAVYYVGTNGKRYVFPNEKTYLTWYSDFSTVKEVTATEMASYKIGGNVTYRPGVKMVKITTSPKVYAVGKGGALKEIASETVAKALYGATWNKQIDDVPDAFFVNYITGSKVNVASDYVIDTEKAASTSINMDMGI